VLSFRVRTTSTCAWSAVSGAPWVTILTNSSGTGEAEVRYAVAPNVLPGSREAVIAIGPAIHTVTQSGVGNDNDDDRDVRLSGRVDGLTGNCPALRFSIGGTIVVTTDDTKFSRGSCRDVRNGHEVTVEGRRQRDGVIEARRVEIE
jgi:hypothetical protein